MFNVHASADKADLGIMFTPNTQTIYKLHAYILHIIEIVFAVAIYLSMQCTSYTYFKQSIRTINTPHVFRSENVRNPVAFLCSLYETCPSGYGKYGTTRFRTTGILVHSTFYYNKPHLILYTIRQFIYFGSFSPPIQPLRSKPINKLE